MSSTHLVTGAGSGIGAALAHQLLERQPDEDTDEGLVLLARTEERADDLRGEFPGAEVLVADLADAAAVEALGEQLPGRLDSLVHAAGVAELGSVADLPTSVWQEQLAVNLVAPAVLTRVALPALRAAQGTVVFVNSGAGQNAHPQWSAYAASKHGLRALADSLRAEEAEHGVRVATVYPGRTATPMQQRVRAQEGQPYDASDWIDPATVARAICQLLFVPPDATVTEVTIRQR